MFDGNSDEILRHGKEVAVGRSTSGSASISACVSASIACTPMPHQSLPVICQDASLALRYIDSIKELRDEVTDRERECAEATRVNKQLQVGSFMVLYDHAL